MWMRNNELFIALMPLMAISISIHLLTIVRPFVKEYCWNFLQVARELSILNVFLSSFIVICLSMEVAKIRLFWPEEGGKLYWSDIPTLLTLPILSWMSLYRAKATPRAWIIISLATAVSSFLLVSPKMNFGEMGSVGSLINLSTLVPISYILALVARFSSIGESLNHSLTASNRSLE